MTPAVSPGRTPARAAVAGVHLAPEVRDYAVRIVRATRSAEAPDGGSSPVSLGASPRASIFLARAARARALLDGRRYTTPHDVKSAAPDVLRHRILVTYEAEADGITPDRVVESVLASVETP